AVYEYLCGASEENGGEQPPEAHAIDKVGKAVVDFGIGVSDFVSDASTFVALGGIASAPFTKGAALSITGSALTVGGIADLSSLMLKYIDFEYYDGSFEDFAKQGLKVSVNIVA